MSRKNEKNSILTIYGCSFLFSLGWSATIPFFAFYLINNEHASSAWIGFALSVSYISYTFSSFKTGVWVDRHTPISLFKWSCLLLLILNLILYVNISLSLFIVLNMIIGLLQSLYRSANNVLLNFYAKEKSQHAYNILYAVYNAGFAIGTLIGAFFVTLHSSQVFIFGASMFLAVFILSFALDNPIILNVKAKTSISFTQLFKISFLVWLLISGVIYFSIYSQINTTLPLLLHFSRENSSFAYAQLLIINATLIVIIQYPIKLLSVYCSFVWIGFAGCFLTSVSLIILGSTVEINWLYGAMILFTIGEALLMPLSNAIIAKNAPPEYLGRYFGFFNFSYIGGFIGPTLGGLFLQMHLPKLLFFFLATLILLTSIFIYYASHPSET